MADTKRITVTLPTDQAERLRDLTNNLSGYVAEAVAEKIRHDLLEEELRRHEEAYGDFTEEELAEAQERIDAAFQRGSDRKAA